MWLIYIILAFVPILVKKWGYFIRIKNRLIYKNAETYTEIYPATHSLKILNYNIFLRSCGISDDFKHGDYKNERLECFINKYIGYYDIVLLQECYNTLSFRCKYIIDRAKSLGFNYCVIPENPSLLSKKIIDSGLVILSKIPIVNTETHIFNNSCYIDSYANKGFQYCELLLNGTSIHIINTHIQSDYSISDNKANLVKLSQINQISEFIKNINQEDPIILAGDLNCNSIYIQNNKPISYSYSGLYTDMLEILNYTKYNDLLRLYNKTRIATTYSVYKNENEILSVNPASVKDLPYYYKTCHKKNIICLPRSVDYIFYNHNKALTFVSTQIKKIEYDNKPLSDHDAIETIFYIN